MEGVERAALLFHGRETGGDLQVPAPAGSRGEAVLRLSMLLPGSREAWMVCADQPEEWICFEGMVKLVLFDARRDSPSFGSVEEFFVGERRTERISIPEGVYRGWQCLSPQPAWMLRCFPAEPVFTFHSAESHIIPYQW